MVIHILFNLKDGAAGGGNQFLKSLKIFLQSTDNYTNTPVEADIIIFNSHHLVSELVKIKRRFPNKVFIHRVDGPSSIYNNSKDKRDFLVGLSNKYIADGTIYQSRWSRDKNYEIGLGFNHHEAIIGNAPNSNIFNQEKITKLNLNKKIKLISISWSDNLNKGFDTYKWLDLNLDFTKYEMIFIGNSPISFNNIVMKPPMSSENLALELKASDIFIFASKFEACSNTLLEALHCGLPVVGYRGTSNIEIIGSGGLLYTEAYEIPSLLLKIVNGYNQYHTSIKIQSIDEIGSLYLEFIKNIYHLPISNYRKLKNKSFLKIKIYLLILYMLNKLGVISNFLYDKKINRK